MHFFSSLNQSQLISIVWTKKIDVTIWNTTNPQVSFTSVHLWYVTETLVKLQSAVKIEFDSLIWGCVNFAVSNAPKMVFQINFPASTIRKLGIYSACSRADVDRQRLLTIVSRCRGRHAPNEFEEIRKVRPFVTSIFFKDESCTIFDKFLASSNT